MVCIYCAGPTKVTNSRHQRHVNHIWRRRLCLQCRALFTTNEGAALAGGFMVGGSAGTLQPFSRDRLFVSIFESCKHRPSAIEDAAGLTTTIITQLVKDTPSAHLPLDRIIEVAAQVLGRFDQIAASVYQAYHQPTKSPGPTS